MMFFLIIAQTAVAADFWAHQALADRVSSAFYAGVPCSGCRFCHTEG